MPSKPVCQFCQGDIDSEATLFNPYHDKCWRSELRIRWQNAKTQRQKDLLAALGKLVAKSLDEP